MDPASGVVLVVIVLLALYYVVLPRLGVWTRSPFARASGRVEPGKETHFTPVHDVAALDPLFARSQDRTVTLFLHDRGCPISAAAYRQMTRLGGEIPLIDVQRAKDVSRAVEARTGVRHESPQVIVLHHGRAIWSASHYAVTAQAVANAIQEA